MNDFYAGELKKVYGIKDIILLAWRHAQFIPMDRVLLEIF